MDTTQFGELAGPAELAEKLRQQAADRRTAMRQAMLNRPLTVNAPPSCPKDLAQQVDGHNAAVGRWEAGWKGLGDDAAGLAMALREPDVRGDVLAEKAGGLRARRYDIAQRLRDVIADRRKVLQGIQEHLAPLIETAQADLAKVVEKAEKALVKAGWLPQAARVTSPGAYPAIEARQLRAAAEQTQGVREAAEVLASLNVADAQARDLLGAQERDCELAEGEILRAWELLLGRLG
jgi:hypothetical protein